VALGREYLQGAVIVRGEGKEDVAAGERIEVLSKSASLKETSKTKRPRIPPRK
jgi:head-tail adaptor